ncbi:hypothetical protein UCDDA912_g01332 [Diaporthe ampelina]|uniref:Uncharacterized protein n=1 Tax=Diaporthe ampelina TaxID=1214573 RepID=A0A0G2FXK7_9PEZI|nr:hypothetical protein UCDDA912_g01332 [Diaporthe ampelina]
MNPNMMNNMGQQGGQIGPYGNNMESIMNEQKQGLLAEQAGQLVVPASSGPGRNATPQPLSGIQPQNMFSQGQNQTPRPQMPNGFDLQQQQQQLKQQMAASHAQAQLRAQAAKGLQVAMGQMGSNQGQPGNPQFGQGLDPRFNQPGGPGPMPGNPNMPQDPAIRAMLAQLDPEQRQKFRQLPADKLNELFSKWKRTGMLRPGQPQQGIPMNPANPANPANHMGNAMHQQPQGGMGPQMQQVNFQNPMNRLRGGNPLQHPQAQMIMDNMDLPGQVMQIIPGIPPDAKKWGQFKAWVSQTNAPIPDHQKHALRSLQLNQFKRMVTSHGQGGTPQQPGAPNQNAIANLPPNTPIPEVTPQEIQQFRMSQQNFREAPEEQIKMQKYELMRNQQQTPEMIRFRTIAQEESKAYEAQRFPDVPMTAETRNQLAAFVGKISQEFNKLTKAINHWFRVSRDEARLRAFVRTRLRVLSQFQSNNNTEQTLKENLTMTRQELIQAKQLLDSIMKDLASIQKGTRPPQQGVSSQNASPQTKVTSPDLKKKEPKAAPKPAFMCTEPGCDMADMGFPTEEARKQHHQEVHVLPYEDPQQFMQQSFAAAFGLDEHGQPKPQPQPAPEEATPMSREASAKQQGGAPGAPAVQGARAGDNKTAAATGPKSTDKNMPEHAAPGFQQSQMVIDPLANTTIDPQSLMAPMMHLFDPAAGGVISDMTLYQSTTPPEDTPESSAKTANLEIDMNWQNFDDSTLVNGIAAFGMDMELNSFEGMASFPNDDMLVTEDMLVDLDKPFTGLDSSLYELNTF